MDMLCFDHRLLPVNPNEGWYRQRSFLYGDGHFTTIKVIKGELQFLRSHLMRLEQANRRLHIKDVDWQKLEIEVSGIAASLESGFTRIHISRGRGGRGYGGVDALTPFIFISTGRWQEPSTNNELILDVLDTCLSQNKLLAGLKHNNRLEQVLIADELEQKSLVDGLVLDTEGNLIETNKANVFWSDGTHWFTPELNLSGVAGVIRSEILKRNPQVIVGVFPIEMVLEQCQSMLICNSLLLVKPVDKLINKTLDVRLLNKLDLSFL